MLADANMMDPWAQTIGLLSVLSGLTRAGFVPMGSGGAAQSVTGLVHGEVSVSLIDRPTSSTATIAWRDSTRCCYGDQVWRSSRARVEGVCAMSGRPIRPGDPVYKPRPCRPMPVNAGAMILTSALDDATQS
jgi:hypothetical protein